MLVKKNQIKSNHVHAAQQFSLSLNEDANRIDETILSWPQEIET